MRHPKNVRFRDFSPTNVFLFACMLLTLVSLFVFSGARQPFSSAEVKFTDASAGGLAIMPASCPSDPHWEGECNPACIITATPNSYNAGSVNTVQIHWQAQQPPPENDSQITIFNMAISGIGGVYTSGTLDVAAPQSSFTYTFDGAYLDDSGNVLGQFTCSAPVTVTNSNPLDLYISQVLLYRSPGDPVSPGDILTYRMSIRNSGTADQNWLDVHDHVPTNTTLTWQGGGTDYNSSGQIAGGVDGNGDVWWQQQSAPAGWSGYVDFSVRVNAGTESGTQICNVGRISSAEVGVTNSNQICNPVASPPPTVTLTANGQSGQLTINTGENYALYRNASDFTSCQLTNTRTDGLPAEPREDYRSGDLPLTTNSGLLGTYTLTCQGPGGSASASVTINARDNAVWTPYCTGGNDPNGNNWQWWEYDNATPPNYRFIRAGDGVCAPPALTCPPPNEHIVPLNNDLNNCPDEEESGGCTMSALPASLSSAGTVALSASIDAFVMTDWTGTLTRVGAVGSSNPGPWSLWVSDDTTFSLEGSYTWFGIPMGSFSCSTTVSVGDNDGGVECDNGDPAPNGDRSQCTCEQGNAAACGENQCREPTTKRCSANGMYWSTYDADGNMCGERNECPWAYAGPAYTCVPGDPPWCPSPTQSEVKFEVAPQLVHKDEKVDVEWYLESVSGTDEPIECTVSGTNGDWWNDTRQTTAVVPHRSRGIIAQTIFSLDCVGTITGTRLPVQSVTVNLIPDFQEL